MNSEIFDLLLYVQNAAYFYAILPSLNVFQCSQDMFLNTGTQKGRFLPLELEPKNRIRFQNFSLPHMGWTVLGKHLPSPAGCWGWS